MALGPHVVALFALATLDIARGAVPPSTVQALRDLWEQTGGPNWSESCSVGTSWNDTDPCDPASPWQIKGRIVCFTSGSVSTVTTLSLQLCNLRGVIPASIGNLVDLTQLYLESNHLSGTIPATVGNLVRLNGLYLNSNQLSGSIPESIGNLTELSQLGLNSNQLSGLIPAAMGNLVRLTLLGLNNNHLSEWPNPRVYRRPCQSHRARNEQQQPQWHDHCVHWQPY
jgi:hypothetical protein